VAVVLKILGVVWDVTSTVWESLRLVDWYWWGMLLCFFGGCYVGCRL
jgi:hypothetical protein